MIRILMVCNNNSNNTEEHCESVHVNFFSLLKIKVTVKFFDRQVQDKMTNYI